MLTQGNVEILKAAEQPSGTATTNSCLGGFEQKMSISNYTGQAVYIKTQSNIVFAIAPIGNEVVSKHLDQNLVEIRIDYQLSGAADFKETLDLINHTLTSGVPLSPANFELTEAVRARIDRDPIIGRHRRLNHVQHFIVNGADLTNGFGYVKELNLMLSFSKAIIAEPHPQSNESWTAPDPRSYSEARQASGNFIRIVDNEQVYPSWFYWSAREVIEVTPTIDRSKVSGVYYSRLKNDNGINGLDTEYLTFEEATERLGLYTTREEAKSNGDPERLIKHEDGRLAVENRSLELQLSKEKHKLQEIEHIVSTKKKEIELLKSDLEHQRFLNERRSEDIKLSSLELKDAIEQSARVRDEVYSKKKALREEIKARRDDHYDRIEKKRKTKYEETSFTLKIAETVVKNAPAIILGAATLYGAYKIATESNRNFIDCAS